MRRRLVLRSRLILFFTLAFLGSPPATATSFELNDTSWEGTSEFLAIARAELGATRVHVLSALDYGALEPSDGVLVLRPRSELSYEQLSRFMTAGGRLAVVDDFGAGARLLSRFQITRVNAPTDPLESLRENPDLAIATPAFQSSGNHVGRHPTAANVDRLVTNHPSVFLHHQLTPILSIRTRSGDEASLAVTGVIGDQGRLLAMGDPSAFINLMLRYAGNREFAKGLVQYLVGPDSWGSRGGDLYIVTNQFSQAGAFGKPPTLLDRAREGLENLMSEIRDARASGLPEVLTYIMAAACCLGAVAWALLRATKTYRKVLPRYALVAPLAAQGGLAGRAAVLAAPSTHRALTMMELKAAVTERLAARLGLDRPSVARILHEASRQELFSPAQLGELENVLRELERIENAFLAQKSPQIREADIDRIRLSTLKLLEAL